ncbi:MAG: UDP-N-acetylglucosamine 1-carboxyvinyltransferase [Bacteroidales bacterium]|nr:UDP-N-acetylglucosamine 1-carboxyvinyltransferase [Bacteroidales bacterium]
MQNQVIINPGELKGDVFITGAKNAVLRHLAASIITDGFIRIDNYPVNMLDVKLHEEMLRCLGKTISYGPGYVIIEGSVSTSELIWEKRSIRNTLLILGALLTKTGYGKVPLPGGCDLGERKYDIHVGLMEAMGAKVWQEGKYLCAKVETKLHGCEYKFPIRSTGATENAVIMGSIADGVTKIWNPHIRPEILDLIQLLREMGADITVNGQESIVIKGQELLKADISHFAVGDSLQAFTYLVAGAIAGKELLIHNFPFEDLEVPLIYLKFSGLNYYQNGKSLIVRKCTPYPIEISTGSYPGVNSDLQPFFAVWGALSQGCSSITDLRYIGRYGYADEFKNMGVNSEVKNGSLIIKGGNVVKGGSTVTALDLRAGAACLLMALIADGPTIINDFWMVERGYDNIIETLRSLGVSIEILS